MTLANIQASSGDLDVLPLATDLVEMIRAPAECRPEAVAVALYAPGRETEPLTWGALWLGARRRASELRALGVENGDRVLIILPTSIEFVEAFFGVLVSGAVPVPVAPPPSLRPVALEHYQELLQTLVGDSGAAFCVSQGRLMEPIQRIFDRARAATRLVCADDQPDAAPVDTPAEPLPEDTALIQYTSGSTTAPKGVVLSHASLIANMSGIRSRFLSSPGRVCFSWLPVFHDMGLIGTFLTALYDRAPVVLMSTRDFIMEPASWLRGMSQTAATFTAAPNFAFDYCVKNASFDRLGGVRLSGLRALLTGAEPIDPDAIRAFTERFAILGLERGVVRPAYGLAESTLAVTFAQPGVVRVDEVDADRLETRGEARPANGVGRSRRFTSVGVPIPGQEIRVVDREDEPLPERRVGEILVRGRSVMKGYHNLPAKSADTLRGGWLHTGDLGYLAAGELYVTSRLKEVIIRHGRNYYPADIEYQVAHVDGVRKGGVAAFEIEDAFETQVVVVVETAERDEARRAALAREIRRRVNEVFLFSPHEVSLVRIGAIPSTTSGKVRRSKTRELYLTGALGA